MFDSPIATQIGTREILCVERRKTFVPRLHCIVLMGGRLDQRLDQPVLVEALHAENRESARITGREASRPVDPVHHEYDGCESGPRCQLVQPVEPLAALPGLRQQHRRISLRQKARRERAPTRWTVLVHLRIGPLHDDLRAQALDLVTIVVDQ